MTETSEGKLQKWKAGLGRGRMGAREVGAEGVGGGLGEGGRREGACALE